MWAYGGIIIIISSGKVICWINKLWLINPNETVKVLANLPYYKYLNNPHHPSTKTEKIFLAVVLEENQLNWIDVEIVYEICVLQSMIPHFIP